jgi:HNH endonuclease
VFVPRQPGPPPFTEPQLRTAVRVSTCWSDVLRRLGLGLGGNNNKTVRKYVDRWNVPTDHFDPDAGRRRAGRIRLQPLEEVLVEHSTYKRQSLKRRLYDEGLKMRACELCGQGEEWRGRRMALILDHVNGVSDDNRLENLQIVCPNCAATLDTHCGRKPVSSEPRACLVCDEVFAPHYPQHRYCSRECVAAAARDRQRGVPRPETRKAERPPYDVLMAEIAARGYSAVGRRYGVSDNAVRKWVHWYEAGRDR